METPKVQVAEHTWLDLSVSWFVVINAVRAGGEIDSLPAAEKAARQLAKATGGHLLHGVLKTGEVHSGLHTSEPTR